VIFSGGPASVYWENAPMPPGVFDLGVPILGICYGQRVMMHCLGGHVEGSRGTAEFGKAFVTPDPTACPPLLDGWFEAGTSRSG
jgi:GMP synthase (glutamine-hydrolysing)